MTATDGSTGGGFRAHEPAERRGRLPTVSVLCAVHERGGAAAASLRTLRAVVDEIVVAFDTRIDQYELGPLEDVADILVGFEFTAPNRFRPWLREQASGDWLFLLDSDEVPSMALVEALTKLTVDRHVSGYTLPRWWLFPNATTRLANPPWIDDRQLRLVRNDGRLWFPGVKHSGAVCEPPTRHIDLPFFHLALLLQDERTRRSKVDVYDSQQFGLMTLEGEPLNASYYLPEDRTELTRVALSSADIAVLRSVLEAVNDRRAPRSSHRTASAAEVERWWTGRVLDAADHRAAIKVIEPPRDVMAGGVVSMIAAVTNLGNGVWFATAFAHGSPIALAYHWFDNEGRTVVFDGHRSELRSRVVPSDTVEVEMLIVAPETAGTYVLAIDLVHEGVQWFSAETRLSVAVGPSLHELLAVTAPAHTIPLDRARAIRRTLREGDGLMRAFLRGQSGEQFDDLHGVVLGGWSLDRDTLTFLVAHIRQHRVERVLEFGSGASTVVLAAELARSGGRILSIDQDEHYARRTREMLDERGLHRQAEVRHAGLVPSFECDVATVCYEFDDDLQGVIRSFAPQLVLIDGPSQVSGASRLAVAPAVARLLPAAASFAMDDAFRDAELEIGRLWSTHRSIDVLGVVPIGKGLLVGTIQTS